MDRRNFLRLLASAPLVGALVSLPESDSNANDSACGADWGAGDEQYIYTISDGTNWEAGCGRWIDAQMREFQRVSVFEPWPPK
jgi:hypothetical protein